MRWYHMVCTYLIIICVIGLAIVPEMAFGLWYGVACVAGIVCGVLGIKYLPMDESKY